MEKFKLNFINNGEGIVDIDEPTGYSSIPFALKQQSKRLARDVFFGGEKENSFSFFRMRNHHIDTLLYYYMTYGWESEVKLIIEIDGLDNIIGDLDFEYAETDQLTYFKCKVIQDNKQATLKKRQDIKVDLFSDKDIEDEDITPVITENVLIKAKPTKGYSKWETPEPFVRTFNADSSVARDTEYYAFNPAVDLVSDDIDDSYSFLKNFKGADTGDTIKAIMANDFILVEAVDNLRNITVDVSNFSFNMDTYLLYGNGYVDYKFELKYGSEWNTARSHIFFNGNLKEDKNFNTQNNYTHKIDFLNRGDKIWLYFFYKVRQSDSFGGDFRVDTTIDTMNIDITSTSISYNTISPSVRLLDATSQVVESISKLSTTFPIAEPNGELYDQRIFNGNLLRGITDKSFNLTLKDISKYLSEIYGDYETQEDNSVFFGIYKDFYSLEEIGFFDTVRYDDYLIKPNTSYAINEFNYKYSKFQSQKESETENSFDIAHGEAQLLLQNKGVENKKEINIPWVRDSFYLDEQRKKAFNLNENTSTQDDKTIFILDTKENNSDLIFTETDDLQHGYNEEDNTLKLSNKGGFSFVLIGISVGESFEIMGGDNNAGSYTVVEVLEREITLSPNIAISDNGDGARATQFQYVVSKITAPYISWSSEGFDYINGVADNDSFSNLKFTIKQNIIKYYNQYLATCNIFTKKPIKITEYINNELLSLSYNGFQTVEGESFTPTNPLLSPYIHTITTIADFSYFIQLRNKIKTNRGYIRFLNAEGHVVKLYPKEMVFVKNGTKGELKVIGEEKYQLATINIAETENYYIINNEYRTRKVNYVINGEKITIFDELSKKLYNPIFWQKLSINGSTAENKEELEKWLKLIS